MLMTGSMNRRPASAYVRDVLAQTKAKNPSEPEFHQAVEEVLESLALLQLAARRRGLRVVLWGANADLRDLIGWAGLDDVMPCAEGSGLEPRWQAEQREQPLGVEEEAEPGDPEARDLYDL